MSKWILLSSLFITFPALAADRWVSCGDHWLEVSVDWSEGTGKGYVYFSGDSGPSRGTLAVDVVEKAGSILVSFPDSLGGNLTVEGMEGENPSATLRETKDSAPQSIGPCSQG